MTRLPWETRGARLHLPRDLDVAYVVGRMGTVRSLDLAPLFWKSPHTARFTFGRLVKLGLLRTFPRRSPIDPHWYALTGEAAPWVAEQMDCEETELRVVSGTRRMNLAAVSSRNRFWVSLVLSARATALSRLLLFRSEWELRRLRVQGVPVVPDAQVMIGLQDGEGEHDVVWFLEFDAGTERSAVWEAKARAYLSVRDRRALYGAERWQVLAIVPSERRAQTVSEAVTRAGAGGFIFVGVEALFDEGRAIETLFWRASELAAGRGAAPRWTLVGRAEAPTPINEADQRSRSMADRGPRDASRGKS